MSETSPGQSPVAAGFIAAGRAVDAGRGWDWIAAGFRLFMKQPGMWILLTLVLIVICVLLGFIPLVGAIANLLLYPVFGAGVMLGCRALDTGGELEVTHAFAGFKQNTSDPVVLVALNNSKPVAALQASFFACLKNFIPFLVYGILLLVLGVIAAIPFGLGFLVLGPVILASIYTAYRDIFYTA